MMVDGKGNHALTLLVKIFFFLPPVPYRRCLQVGESKLFHIETKLFLLWGKHEVATEIVSSR